MKDNESETTTSVSYPSWYEKLLKGTSEKIGEYVENPDVKIAGRTKDQTAVGQGYRDLMSYLGGTQGLASGSLDTLGQYLSAVNAARDVDTVTPSDISALANPYMEEQQRIGMDRLNEGRAAAQSSIGQRAAAAGAFGGSREAIERSNLTQDYLSQVDAMRAQTAADAYGMGAHLATNNAAATNQGRQAAAGYLMQGVTSDQNAYGLSSDLANQYTGRMATGLSGLYGYGNDMQGFNQARADADSGYTAYGRLMPILGGPMPKSQTEVAPSNNGGAWGSALMGMRLLNGGF